MVHLSFPNSTARSTSGKSCPSLCGTSPSFRRPVGPHPQLIKVENQGPHLVQVGKLNPEEGGTRPGSQSGLGSRKWAGRQGSDPHASHTVGAEAGRAGGLGGLLPGEQREGPSTWLKQIWVIQASAMAQAPSPC